MKKLLALLHGNWFGHPLHPMLVNLPTALWPMALVFDLLSHTVARDGQVLVRTAWWAILLGLAAVVTAIPTGLADWSDVGRDKPAWKLGLAHLVLNVLATLLWAINFSLRFGPAWDAEATPPVPLALSVIGTLLLMASAYLGGRMVFDQGTYVGWMSLKEWRQRAIAGGARVPPES